MRAAIYARRSTARAFDVVVARDESRIGGDTHRTGIMVQDLLDRRTPSAPPHAPEPSPEPAPARITSLAAPGSPRRQASMFAEPRPAVPALLVLEPPAPEPDPRRAPASRPQAETKGPGRNLAFEDLKPSEMSAWERTPSLFGQAGPVPPAQPGEQRAPKQKRLPF